jgi:uncharacterized SAM-binding protein YcdF (DUF218 family)
MEDVFFIVSKIAWAFLSPANVIIFASFLGALFLIFNRISAAKKLLIPTGLIAFTIMAYPVSDYLMEPLEKRFAKPETMPYEIDGIIVLGGGEELARSLSWNTAELGIAGDRYIGAAKLASIYPRIPIIFSGGSGDPRLQNSGGEAAIAKQLLTSVGVPEYRLIIESESRNTFENFVNTKPLLPKADGKYLLVTSAFHMPRAVGVAQMQGINLVPYPVDYRTHSEDYRKFNFNLYDNLKSLEPAWKEWIGLTVYWATGKTERIFPGPQS